MLIVYNPKDGAPITSFISNGVLIDPHYPDGYETSDGKISNGLIQYNDFIGEEILETFEFLEKLSVEQAKEILSRPVDPRFACDFPGCEFKTTAKIGLEGHKRKHAKEIAASNEAAIDPSMIPVAGGRKIPTLAERKQMSNNDDIPNGSDKDGVDWYGDGVTVENHSTDFNAVRQTGKGHFIG